MSMCGHVFVNTDYSLNVTSGFQEAPTAGRITAVHTSLPSDKCTVGHWFAVYNTPHKLKKQQTQLKPLNRENPVKWVAFWEQIVE